MNYLSANPATFDIIGTPLSVTSYGELISYCKSILQPSRTWAVDFTNTHIVALRRHDASFRAVTSKFDLFIPDGMPLVWCLNHRGAKLRNRVYGPTFMRMCVVESTAPFTHYFLGGSSKCVAQLKERFLLLNPSVQIVGVRDGYFGISEEKSIVDEINRLSPDFIWIGLGTPKQQEWIYRNKGLIKRGVIFAVGFAFDVNAGIKKDAPEWMQRLGLTWLFRIVSEPHRLFGRYLRYNTLFLFYIIRDALLRRKRADARSGVKG